MLGLDRNTLVSPLQRLEGLEQFVSLFCSSGDLEHREEVVVFESNGLQSEVPASRDFSLVSSSLFSLSIACEGVVILISPLVAMF